MSDLTYAELFAGAGGLSMGLELVGWSAVAHAEIEPHARAVLREHWPECRLDGDVSAINGADYAGVTLLSGGSPCQDLSVAGKRGGMTEGSGTRSSLYFEQVRIWNESGAPYFLWENVLGAFSSNAGRDFAAVLSAIVGAPVPVPADGWQSAGVAAGPTGVAAWRVLDCQFFGPPQRRRRVFVLGARARGVDPAEVLAVSEGVRGDTPARGEAREGVASDARGGAGGAGVLAFDTTQVTSAANRSNPQLGDPCHPLASGAHPPLAVTVGGDVSHALSAEGCDASEDGTGRGTPVVAVLLRNREGKPGGGKGPLLSEERSLTLAQANDQVLFTMASGQANAEIVRDGAPTLNAMNHRDGNANGGGQMGVIVPVVAPTFSAGAHPGGVNGQDAPQVAAARIAAASGVGIPRRLMPIETERLQGWPDGHTQYGIAEDGTRYALSDTARYRLCGNGCAAPVVAWIGWRLRWAIEGA